MCLMTLIIYKNGKPFEQYNFNPKDIDKVKKVCYTNNIKWFVIIGEQDE